MKQKYISIGKTYFIKDASHILPGLKPDEKFTVSYIKQQKSGKMRYYNQQNKWICAEDLTVIPCCVKQCPCH